MKFQQINEGLGQDADHMEQDHEVQMARADCFHAAKNAIELHRMLRDISERQGLEGWVSEKITLAADYLSTVKEYLEYEMMGRPDEFDIGPKTEYDQMFGQYMSENQHNKKKVVKEAEQNDPEGKITTPGLNARARELLIKAYGRFPESENDISALVNYLSYLDSRTGQDANRLGDENQVQDRNINRLEKQNDQEDSQIELLTQEVRALRDQVSMMSRHKMGESQKKRNKHISEMTAGGTGAGSVAAVVTPLATKKKSKKRPVNEVAFLAAAPAIIGGAARLAPLAAAGGAALLRNPRTAAIATNIASGLMRSDDKEPNKLELDDAKRERIAARISSYQQQIAELERQMAEKEKLNRSTR